MIRATYRLGSFEVEKVLKEGFSLRTQGTPGVRAKALLRNTPATRSRFAVVVSKKTAGSAVERNRQRRMAFAALSTLPPFKKPYDIVVMLGKTYGAQASLAEDIQEALARLV